MRGYLVLSTAALALAACASESPPDTSASGPPRVLDAAIERHAEQFEDELPLREPGSEEELGAAAYILGHLQRAGYVPLLDSVPVGNLVESTNVVALPVSGEDPEHLVAVSYGATEPGSSGDALGVFLELARALKARDPQHAVAFVALGAEESQRFGGSLGTRRLLRYLDDQALSPHIVSIAEGDRLSAGGSQADALVSSARGGEVVDPPRDDLYRGAQLEHTVVTGPPADVGAALLAYLGR